MNDEIRTTIARAALAVARHVHDSVYAAVVVSGGSHQLSRSLLTLGWGVLYPDTAMPQTFVLDAYANELLYKNSTREEVAARELSAWIAAKLPGLEAMKGSRLCFVDDFAISGMKYFAVRRSLTRDHNFQDVHFAFFAAKEDLELELESDIFIGTLKNEAVTELHRLSQHIQGKEDAAELLDEIRPEAVRLRTEALGELRNIGREMKGSRR